MDKYITVQQNDLCLLLDWIIIITDALMCE